MKLGATGDFPEGKLNEDDEGGLNVGIADDKQGNVVINFGRPLYWVAMPKETAVEFALLILKHAGVEINLEEYKQ